MIILLWHKKETLILLAVHDVVLTLTGIYSLFFSLFVVVRRKKRFTEMNCSKNRVVNRFMLTQRIFYSSLKKKKNIPEVSHGFVSSKSPVSLKMN